MAKKYTRDWILSEEAAVVLGIGRSRFSVYLVPELREKYLPNSVLVGRTWIHHINDVERLKRIRAKYPPRNRPRKGKGITEPEE